jgi:hypothetical protein
VANTSWRTSVSGWVRGVLEESSAAADGARVDEEVELVEDAFGQAVPAAV